MKGIFLQNLSCHLKIPKGIRTKSMKNILIEIFNLILNEIYNS